jgi:hypothetical protein
MKTKKILIIVVAIVILAILVLIEFLEIKNLEKKENINFTEQKLLESLLLENYWPSHDLALYEFEHPDIPNRDLYKSYWTVDGTTFEIISFFDKRNISELLLSFSVINNGEAMDNEKAKAIVRNFSRIILEDWKCETNEVVNFCENSWIEDDQKICIDFEYPVNLEGNTGIYNFHIYKIFQEGGNYNLQYCREIYQK